MSEILAAIFEGAEAARRALERLRAVGSEHAMHLEEACAVRREADGRLAIEEAIDGAKVRRLPHGFWHRWLSHLLVGHNYHRGEVEACVCRPFCQAVAEALGPDHSGILIHVEASDVEPLARALEAEGAKVLHAPTNLQDGELVQRLEEMLVEVPSAEQLASLAQKVENQRVLQARARQRAADEARRLELERLRAETLAPAELDVIMRRCADAARRGATKLVVLTFPAELLEDHARRINQEEPDWPTTLAGRAKAFYRFFKSRLEPLGYRLEAKVIGYEDGVPSTVAFVLDWSHVRKDATLEEA